MEDHNAAGPPASAGRNPSGPKFAIISAITIAMIIADIVIFRRMTHWLAAGGDRFAFVSGTIFLEMAALMFMAWLLPPKDPEAARNLPVINGLTAASVAATLLLPMIGRDRIDPRLNFAVVMALMAACVWFSWRQWRADDELERARMREIHAVNYLVLAYALSIYAVGERLGLFAGLTAWNGLVFAVIVGIPVGLLVYLRRGVTLDEEEE